MKRSLFAVTVFAAFGLLTAVCGSAIGQSSSATGGASQASRANRAPDGSLPKSTYVDDIKKSGVFRVGIASSPPNIIQNVKGDVWEGIYPDLVNYIGEKLGVKVEYIPTRWAEAVAGLQANRWDMMPDFGITEERAKAINFTIPVHYNTGVFTILPAKNPQKDWPSLNVPGVTICTVTGTTYDAALTVAAPVATVLRLPSSSNCLAALASNRVTTYYGSWTEATGYCGEHSDTKIIFPDPLLQQNPTANGVNKKYSVEDIAAIDVLIKEWKADPKGFTASVRKWAGAGNPLDYTISPVNDGLRAIVADTFGAPTK